MKMTLQLHQWQEKLDNWCIALQRENPEIDRKSKGHVRFSGDGKTEYFRGSQGDIYEVPTEYPVMPDESRSGRFYCTAAAWEQYIKKGGEEASQEDKDKFSRRWIHTL